MSLELLRLASKFEELLEPYQVCWVHCNKRNMCRVFPNKEIALEFALTVNDPFVQPASEILPDSRKNEIRNDMTDLTRRQKKKKEEAPYHYLQEPAHIARPKR